MVQQNKLKEKKAEEKQTFFPVKAHKRKKESQNEFPGTGVL